MKKEEAQNKLKTKRLIFDSNSEENMCMIDKLFDKNSIKWLQFRYFSWHES